MNWPDSRTDSNRFFSSSASGAYCAWTSTSGIFGTAVKCRGAPVANYSPHDRSQDRRRDHVFGVAERVVELLPARAEGPACAGEREGPRQRARDRQQRVAAKRHPEDAGRDRDEGADNGRDATDRDAPIAEPLEPRLGFVERVRRDVQPDTAAL